jgi:succinyl-diaminopimelate desuccinylase
MEVWFNFRFSTESTEEALKARVHTVLDAHGLEYELKWALSGAPFLSPRGGLVDVVSEAVRAVDRRHAGALDERRHLRRPVPRRRVARGDRVRTVSASIHGIDEHVTLADILPLSQVFERALATLCRTDRDDSDGARSDEGRTWYTDC